MDWSLIHKGKTLGTFRCVGASRRVEIAFARSDYIRELMEEFLRQPREPLSPMRFDAKTGPPGEDVLVFISWLWWFAEATASRIRVMGQAPDRLRMGQDAPPYGAKS